MITSLGASTAGEEFKEPFANSIKTLSENQSEHGQIPNAVGSYNEERKSDVTFNTIDSSLLYIIGHHAYKTAYNDGSLYEKYKKNIDEALKWLQYQDPNEDKLLVQEPTMDWQDAFPHRYGRTINTEALYYGVLKIIDRNDEAEHIKNVVNGETEQYLSLYDKKLGYYLPWIWKTHGPEYREEGRWFDTMGNLFSIITGLATPEISKSILDYIEKEGINRPYPCKTIYPPIKEGDPDWRDYYKDSDAGEPYNYLNGGIWPFIGGFYIAALVKAGQMEKAEAELEKLAEAVTLPHEKDAEHGFHEWLQGQTGQPGPNSNTYQAWTAGMYVYAYNCLKNKTEFYF